MNSPIRDPNLDPVPNRDPLADPTHPDYVSPANRRMGYGDPIQPRRSAGIGGAAIVGIIVLLAVIGFALFGGSATNEAGLAPTGEPAIEGTQNPPTGSITPEPAPAEPVEPAAPATPAPAQ